MPSTPSRPSLGLYNKKSPRKPESVQVVRENILKRELERIFFEPFSGGSGIILLKTLIAAMEDRTFGSQS
jgi:hypothetical protein